MPGLYGSVGIGNHIRQSKSLSGPERNSLLEDEMKNVKITNSLIFCSICNYYIPPILTTGKEIYPHRPDLFDLKFFKCPECGGYVGTHKDSGEPLGCIVSAEVKKARIKIHNIIDPLWKSGKMKRQEIYKKLSEFIGKEFHTAKIRTMDEANGIIEYMEAINDKSG